MALYGTANGTCIQYHTGGITAVQYCIPYETHVRTTYVHTYTHTHVIQISLSIHTYIHTYDHSYTHTHTHIHTYAATDRWEGTGTRI